MTDYSNTTRHQLYILQYSLRLFIFGLLFWSLSGCANLNCTRLEGLLGGKTNLVTFSYKIAESAPLRRVNPIPNSISAKANTINELVIMYMNRPKMKKNPLSTSENFRETLSAMAPVGTSNTKTARAEMDCNSIIWA